jgi:hypothetical protein
MALTDGLIVLVGLVLAVALGARELAAARRRSAQDLLRAELRRLALAQESFFYDHGVYAGDVLSLSAAGFRPSPGIRLVVHEATLSGWSAAAWKPDAALSCAVFVRSAAPIGAARVPGEIRCD